MKFSDKSAKGAVEVEKVAGTALCTGCGTCAGVCLATAIEMREDTRRGVYRPVLDRSKCIGCNLCAKVCPVIGINAKGYSSTLIGNHISCYVGHSTDKKLRYNSTSGGLVTQLLVFAIDNGLIDGAIVTKMSSENPLRPEVTIARSKKEIIDATKSKYCPVPVNIAIRDIVKNNGRFAIVGLPCHIHGMRRAETVITELRKKIVLHVGLFCSHNVSFLGTKFLLERLNIDAKDVSEITYRGKGWPGGMTITLRNGMERFIPLRQYWNQIFGLHFFTPFYCLFCTDMANELADISFGDAWLPELQKQKRNLGESIVVVRAHVAEKILQEMSYRKIIRLREISAGEVVKSQLSALNFKKRNIGTRTFLLRYLLRKPLVKCNKSSKRSSLGYLNAVLVLLNYYLGQKNYTRKFLMKTPFVALKLYSFILHATNR